MRKTIYTRQAECVRETIVEMRQKAGLSQRQLAERLGRERNLVGRLEVGQRRLDVVEFYSICKACDADLKNVLQRLLHKFEEIQTVAGQPEKRAGRRVCDPLRGTGLNKWDDFLMDFVRQIFRQNGGNGGCFSSSVAEVFDFWTF